MENKPEYINSALELGYDVEIDIWVINDLLYLGHCEPNFHVDITWLIERKKNLWIHCKNIQALFFFKTCSHIFNYFWHQSDDFAMTSFGEFWTYPGKDLTSNSIACLPEICDFKNLEKAKGVCSDFISKYLSEH